NPCRERDVEKVQKKLKKGLTFPCGLVIFVNARLRATRSTKRTEPRKFYSLKADIKHSPC
ncbi:hypothetical protein, partial [Crocosphaera watsonii]|uniref:hypothetical protein n=1 Tax=Crocosphaera watsonii TaxID=263511 RepID=UPI000651D3A7